MKPFQNMLSLSVVAQSLSFNAARADALRVADRDGAIANNNRNRAFEAAKEVAVLVAQERLVSGLLTIMDGALLVMAGKADGFTGHDVNGPWRIEREETGRIVIEYFGA